MYLDEGSKISFEAPKMDILRPSYECLKFTKRIELAITEKTTYVQSYPFSQILSCTNVYDLVWNIETAERVVARHMPNLEHSFHATVLVLIVRLHWTENLNQR